MATAGRKKLPAAPAPEPEVLAADQQHIAQALDAVRADAAAQALVASQHDAAVRAIAAQIGYRLPADCTDPELIQRDISANMRRSVDACLEVGRGLCVLKEVCAHGQFIDRLDVIGLDRKVAAKFMQSARKFSNVSSTRHLLEAAGSQTKLFELLVLDDAEVEELALTGQTGELTLDDVASMSVKELRAALRETRADLEATQEISAEKTQRIESLQKAAKAIATLPDDAELARLQNAASLILSDVRGGIIGQLRQALLALDRHGEETDHRPAVFMAGLVAQLMTDLAVLRDEFNLVDIDANEHGWIDAEADHKAA